MANPKKTDSEIESRYIEEDRNIKQERNDFLLPQIIDFVHHKKWMNLNPEYQRRQVWDRSKQSQFIESLLMNLPVPPVFLYEPEYSNYEVMDGQQRLTSIVKFYSNELKLTGLEYWTELNNKNYSELPPVIQRGLDRRRISAVILQKTGEESKIGDLRKIVFERLNTGGQKLNSQELRNCIYAGNLAEMLVTLAGYPAFNDLWEIPRYIDNIKEKTPSKTLAENNLYNRMTDCELVLRFFAFRERKNIKGSVKTILDNFMKHNANQSKDTIDDWSQVFKSRVDLAHDIFGLNAFKIPNKTFDKFSHSQSYYDAIMIACDKHFDKASQLISRKEQINNKINDLLKKDESHFDLLTGKGSTAILIKKRFDLISECFA